MTPETSAILARLEALNASVTLTRQVYSYITPATRWSCQISVEHKGSELRTIELAPTLDEAIQAAWAKISPIVDTLAFSKSFDIPLLTIESDCKQSDSL